jgi:CRP/FNR family transcriptional regulator, cyclic AMP receptor protein
MQPFDGAFESWTSFYDVSPMRRLITKYVDFKALKSSPVRIALRIIEILCSKLRRTTERAEEVMSLDLPSRLAKALLRVVDADTAGMRERKISTTQRDLGNIIGMSRESTNKQLRIWEDKKWVRLERNAVVILATDRLAAVAGGGHQCLP